LIGASLTLGLAGTMTPVSFVLFARHATGSFATASLVLAAATTGGIMLAPLRGRLVDRLGAARVVLWLALPSAATNALFLLAGERTASAPILVALGLLSGAIAVPAGAALRSVWSELLADSGAQQAGYSLMTVNQEVTFVAGPLLAGGAIALWSPGAAVAIAAVLELAGALAFASSRAARATKPHEAETAAGTAPLVSSGLRTVLGTAAAFGLVFGLLDVGLPAVATRGGSPASAGVLLATLALGIGVGGMLYGLLPVASASTRRYPALCLLAAMGTAPLMIASPLGAMIPLALLCGLCFAPVTTAQIAVIDHVAPAGRKGEAFSWIGTLYGAGAAAGAALAGQLIAHGSPRAVFAVACGAGALAWLVAALRARTLDPM
jgi:MFS family permease